MTGDEEPAARWGGPTGTPRPAEPEGGDPACWLHRVCPAGGRLAEEEPPVRCAACGAPVPGE